METNYSLVQLWPEFDRLKTWDVTSAEGLSALFVVILIIGVISFSLLSILNYWRASRHLKFYRGLLKGLTAEQLLEKRREISNKALSNKAYGRLWREFDESLVHIPQKERLCNTLDAGHFFNTHSISRGLTENRLLAAVPGFLTAIGVIGTFAGLQMGLSSLSDNMGGSLDIDEIKIGIFGMIGGASIAFMTSVWGVFTSVIFNIFEKILERNIRASITAFQNDVDYLYPRITAEQSLSNIEEFSRQSTEKLAELDEKIGHKMQEAMSQASVAIREGLEQSLSTILGPAIEKLVNNANSGSEKALESLLEKFLNGVGSAGNAQKDMMQQAAKDISQGIDGMTNGMEDFANKLDDKIETMVGKNSDILNGVQESLLKQVEEQQGREIARQKLLHDQINSFQGTQKQLTSGIDNILETQHKQSKELSTEFNQLIERFSSLSTSHEQATLAMQQASTDMKATSNQLGLLSGNVKSAADNLTDKITSAVDHADSITQLNKQSMELFNGLVEQVSRINSQIESTAQTMNNAAEKADSGFSAVDRHFDKLSQSLREHVQQLEEQVANLLNDYAERVQSQTVTRLNVWNENTNSYIGSMTDAVRALNDVVDEIDGKIRR